MNHLTIEQQEILAALAEPGGHKYIGGVNVIEVFELERLGLLQSKPDRIFPSFLAYSITDKGRDALTAGKFKP